MNALLLMAFSFCLSVMLNRSIAPIGRKIGLVDVPSGNRRHRYETPLVGGIAMYLVIVVSSSILYYSGENGFSASVLVAAGLLTFMGAWDDRYGLTVKTRLGVQTCVATIIVLFDNIIIRSFGPLLSDELFQLGILAVPFSVFAIVGCINAFNMVDGIDGLAGMIALAFFSTTAFLTVVNGTTAQLTPLLCLMGIVIGFLIYNFPFKVTKHVSVFMGDAGSNLLGFLIAVLLIRSQTGPNMIQPVTALWLIGIPIYDTVGVIFRRIGMKKSPLKGDRNHLHHLLLDAGFGTRQVVLILFVLQIGMGFTGVLALSMGVPDSVMFYTFICGGCLYCSLTLRPHRVVPVLQQTHERVHYDKPNHQRVFVGNLPADKVEALGVVSQLFSDHPSNQAFHLFSNVDKQGKSQRCYCVVRVESNLDEFLNYLTNKNAGENRLIFREYHYRKKSDRRSEMAGFSGKKPSQLELFADRRRFRQNPLIYSSIRD